MKFSIIVKILLTVFIFIFFAANVGNIGGVKAQRGRCGNQTFCADPDISHICLPLPTSLPSISSTWNGGYGFSFGSSNCGARRCWYLFTCRCGPALGAGICNSSNGSSGSTCIREEVKNVK